MVELVSCHIPMLSSKMSICRKVESTIHSHCLQNFHAYGAFTITAGSVSSEVPDVDAWLISIMSPAKCTNNVRLTIIIQHFGANQIRREFKTLYQRTDQLPSAIQQRALRPSQCLLTGTEQ